MSNEGGGTISSKAQGELVNVTKIYPNSWAFAALRSDGTVRAWGSLDSMLGDSMLAQWASLDSRLAQ